VSLPSQPVPASTVNGPVSTVTRGSSMTLWLRSTAGMVKTLPPPRQRRTGRTTMKTMKRWRPRTRSAWTGRRRTATAA